MKAIIDRLFENENISDEDFFTLMADDSENEYLCKRAEEKKILRYGRDIYVRGLVEVSNYCKNGCYYCGINSCNKNARRYRLSHDEILKSCKRGYEIGFRSFVLQGGEDDAMTDEFLCSLIKKIKENCPECAVTLSLGERSRESYEALYKAGAARYLLRHETATEAHYGMLHPEKMKLSNRIRCLYDLKEIGYQVGTGFMVGAPYQTAENILADIRFMQDLSPDMIGIGPFVSHPDTEFAGHKNGDVETTIKLVAILRLLFPHALIPATTSLITLDESARIRGLSSGANVIMPNLTPQAQKSKYELYKNKASTGCESAENFEQLKKLVAVSGHNIVIARGDVKRA